MKNTDYIIINLLNNGYAVVNAEHETKEMTNEQAKSLIATLRNQFKVVDYKRYDNNDVKIVFN